MPLSSEQQVFYNQLLAQYGEAIAENYKADCLSSSKRCTGSDRDTQSLVNALKTLKCPEGQVLEASTCLDSVRRVIARLDAAADPRVYTIKEIALMASISANTIHRDTPSRREYQLFKERCKDRVLSLIDQGYTLSAIVKRCGVSHPTLNKWRRERQLCS